MKDIRPLILAALLLLLVVRLNSSTLTQQADRATYVYERQDTSPPRPVLAALRKLNEAGKVKSSAVDKDAVTGTGQVPEQYKVAFEAAKGKLPCLVVQAGEKVLAVVEDPKTEEDVREAVK